MEAGSQSRHLLGRGVVGVDPVRQQDDDEPAGGLEPEAAAGVAPVAAGGWAEPLAGKGTFALGAVPAEGEGANEVGPLKAKKFQGGVGVEGPSPSPVTATSQAAPRR